MTDKQANPVRPECPAVAVDVLLFSIREGRLNILLAKISQGPYEGKWAMPGGLVGMGETLDQAAENVLNRKAGIKGVYLEQLYSFGDLDRDARGRSVSVAYFALVDSDRIRPSLSAFYSEIDWHPVSDLPFLAFDHERIIRCGLERLASKIEYSNIAYALLPKEFTLSELQEVYQIILGRGLDKRNFRKKIASLGLIEPVKRQRAGLRSRPAELYRFRKRSLVMF